VHEWNALQAPGGGLRLVDPDGLLAELEYDLGVMMREDPVELMHGDPRERVRRLASAPLVVSHVATLPVAAPGHREA
jgi:streptomycin 6-kinase